MIETCNVLCIVSDDSSLVINCLGSQTSLFNYYSHLYCYTPNPNLINFNNFNKLPEISISRYNDEESLSSILLWSQSCTVDLIILSNDDKFLKEVSDRYGYKRNNVNVIKI